MRSERDLLIELDEQLRIKLNSGSTVSGDTNINEIKILKNGIYQKVTQVFIYNLKKLIQLEGTQKQLAKKIGISEDLLSKYKSGDAFPAIETLIYMAAIYRISLEALFNLPFDHGIMEDLEAQKESSLNKGTSHLFERVYYLYFLVTNVGSDSRVGAIHEAILEIDENSQGATFKIYSDNRVVKSFRGNLKVSERLVYFNFSSANQGEVNMHMARPNLNKNSYVGGMALMLLPSDARSKPCCQKVLFSRVKLNRDEEGQNIKALLCFDSLKDGSGHIKVTPNDDEMAYSFVRQFL